MGHWYGKIGFVVEVASDCGDGSARHKLSDEDHGTPDFGTNNTTHVETKIDLFKGAMERNRKTENTRAPKHEPDDAYPMGSVPIVKFGSGWHERLKNAGRTYIVQ
jgi:hypothetical protein